MKEDFVITIFSGDGQLIGVEETDDNDVGVDVLFQLEMGNVVAIHPVTKNVSLHVEERYAKEDT